jgi:3-deoxy-D-manno-octulosonic acid kinase
MPAWKAPAGCVVERRGDAVVLVAVAEHAGALKRAGLDRVESWEAALQCGQAAGRGRTTRVQLDSGMPARLKRLRRGGLAAALWRDRFFGTRRLLDNLRLVLEARRRGVATPAALGLLVARAGFGLHAGWLAVEDLEGAVDLRSRLAAGPAPRRSELAAALAVVRRMHDAGLDHRDLNLANVLVRSAPSGEPEAFVVDLDAARLRSRPLGFHRRLRALRRLERSHVKLRHGTPVDGDAGTRRAYYELYAGHDVSLARRLERGRRRGAWRIELHRLGWKG